jgi:hypothetical protein
LKFFFFTKDIHFFKRCQPIIKNLGLGEVPHVTSTTQEVKIRKIEIPGQFSQKVTKIPSQQRSWAWLQAPVTPSNEKLK